jgi:S-DNA-T family DNA segregation ATPase FtsK/SpoIIIE
LKRNRKKRQKREPEKFWKFEIIGILVFSFSLLSLLSLLKIQQMGYLINIFGKYLKILLGEGSYLVPLLLFLISYSLIVKRELKIKFSRINIGIVMIIIIIFPFLSLVSSDKFQLSSLLSLAKEGKGGGIVGGYLNYLLILGFGEIGAYIVIITIFLISLSLIFGGYLYSLYEFLSNYISIFYFKTKNLLSISFKLFKIKISEYFKKIKIRKKTEIKEELEEPKEEKIETPISEEEKLPEVIKEDVSIEEQKEVVVTESEKIETKKFKKVYQLPPLSLLKEKEKSNVSPKTIQEQKEKILQTLLNFGIEGEIKEISQGPRIIRYELQPAAGIKVREIVSLADDLALHLAVSPIRVEAPIPGKSAIGIEVPNKVRSIVYIKGLLEKIFEIEDRENKFFFCLGEDIAGNPKIAELTKMPHLLIAGQTGSGKSVCLNSLICSFLFTKTPEEIKFLLIDPKRVELTNYNGIPHLIAPVIVDSKTAAIGLEIMVKKMEERFEMFAEEGVRNIEGYNSGKPPEERIPYIAIIIDELADLIFQTQFEVERNICRIAQMARATGIHLVIATQRPSVNVITGLIKANIPSRISFAVASQTDSRTILDMNGAEKLLGEGDMLYLPVDAAKPTRIQGAFISEEEIRKVVDFWKQQGEPIYENEFLEIQQEEKKFEEIEIDDELFKEAVSIVISKGEASASMLQRKLKIGYARAGRLIDLMEKKGIVGPPSGSKPREVLVGWEYFENKSE